ncbi:hypothetical protein AgCh_011224 [Apium graveolens]
MQEKNVAPTLNIHKDGTAPTKRGAPSSFGDWGGFGAQKIYQGKGLMLSGQNYHVSMYVVVFMLINVLTLKKCGGLYVYQEERVVQHVTGLTSQNGGDDSSDSGLENHDLGPFFPKKATYLMSSGDNPQKALQFAIRAAKSFEKCEDGQDHALAKYLGHMQLGDSYAVVGRFENSIMYYTMGLGVQIQVMGDKDPRFGETCRYDDVIFAYQKTVMTFQSTKGENHPTVAAVFVRLADQYKRREKLKDSKSYCENVLQFYEKPLPGCPLHIASALTVVSAIHESQYMR